MKKTILLLVLSAAVFSGNCLAQASSPSSGSSSQGSSAAPPQTSTPTAGTGTTQVNGGNNAAPSASQLQPGSLIYAELAKSVDSKKVKVGDEVQAKATQGVLSQGKVVIPKGSKILGKVTQVSAKGSDQQPSQLGINFDHAVLKDGTQVPLSVSLQALGGGASAASAGMDPSPSNSQANRGISSSGMPGRASGEAAGGYGAPGGNMGGMGTTNAGAGAGAGGMGTTDAGPSTVHLNAGSRGVVGLGGLSLSEGPQGAVITSDKKNVKLDSGIELILREK
jgi:hypothetical protein